MAVMIAKTLRNAAAAVLLSAAPASHAASVALSYTVTSPSTGTYAVLDTGNTPVGTISPSASFSLGNSFPAVNPSVVGAPGVPFQSYDPVGAPLGANGSGGPWNFQDSWYFSMNDATVQASVISATLSNVSNLQLRVIRADGNTPSAGAPRLGPVSGTVIQSWQTLAAGPLGFFSLTSQQPLTAGAYVLQVRGFAGANDLLAPSSYGGTIAFAPVPLPAAAWFMLGGLGLLAVSARRSRSGAPARRRLLGA